jgi:cell division transport system ATP-binding protein
MIEFRHVTKKYSRDSAALSDINFSVAKGELVFLSGPSGAGKSTLLKMIAAIERPSSGSVEVNGQDIGRLNALGLAYLRRKLGLILQQQSLLFDRPVLANVMLPLIVTGTPRADAEKRARAALDKVGLLDRAASAPQSLSGGEQQRIAIARAIVNRPQLILADEPTASLDRANAMLVLDAIQSFQAVGVTCIISTHDDTLMPAGCRTIYLQQGRIVNGAVAASGEERA